MGAGTVKCSYCGHVYPLLPTQEEPRPEPPQAEGRKPEAPQPQNPEPTARPVESKNKSRFVLFIALVACVVIAIIAFVAMSIGGSDEDSISPYDDNSYISPADSIAFDSEPVPDYEEEQAATEQAAEEAEIHSFIRDMYNNRRYDDDAFLRYHCSPPDDKQADRCV